MLLLALLGCLPTPADKPADTGQPPGEEDSADSADSADSGGADCTPVAAIFFDLGETLVTEGEDGLFTALPGAGELLDALEARGLPLGLISNTGRGWDLDDVRALLVDPSLLDRFDVILLSSQAESRPKPDPAIFAEAVALLAPAPAIGATVFVTEEQGDLADADPPTEGAQAAGMIGVLVTTEEAPALVDHRLDPADLPALAEQPWLDCLEAGD